jgi:SepF-like predicted cell division protein (DUF552 family)
MKRFLSKLSGSSNPPSEQADDDYVELDTAEAADRRPNTMVRPFTVTEFQDVKEIINVYREGRTVCILDISRLRRNDMMELKRLINKLKKTVDAMNGEIAGISGGDEVLVVPSHITIHRGNTSSVDVDADQ